jgi:2-succinyl-6-hydroxy-2,4-cyclohexadiene-1-carboxylate synthase
MVTRVIGETRWHYDDTGDAAGGSLVLLHGFTGCRGVWSEIVNELKSEYRCIVPDLPGHGRTETPDQIAHYQLESVADSLARLLRDIGVERTMMWGYSMGGRVALQFATAFTDRLTRLVLESTSPGLADPQERSQRQQTDNALADEIEALGVEAFIRKWESQPMFLSQRRLPEAKQRRMHDLRRGKRPEGLALSLRGMGAGAQQPLHNRLSGVHVPTLVLLGEEDTKFRAISSVMVNAMPAAISRIVPGAGHTTFWEQPEACLTIVRPFLQGKEAPELF